MADAVSGENTAPQGKGPDGQVNTSDEVVKNENHLRQLIAERDEAKARLKKIEADAEAARQREIEEKGLFKSELEKLKPEYERLKAFQEQYAKRLEADIASLESKLPKDYAEEYEGFIKKLDAEARKEWLSRKVSTPPAPKDSPAGGRPGATGKTQAAFNAMSFEQRMELKRTDPESFARLIKG